jgi:hypothetical protein
MDALTNESPLDLYLEEDDIIDFDLNDVSDEEIEYPVKDESLMSWCAMSLQVKEDDLK